MRGGEREREREKRKERERERENPKKAPHSTEPVVGLSVMNFEIMT